MTIFIESNDLLGVNQGGFRKGYRTSDHIFILKTLALATVAWKCNNDGVVVVTLETGCRNAGLGWEPINYECNNDVCVYGYIALLLHRHQYTAMYDGTRNKYLLK